MLNGMRNSPLFGDFAKHTALGLIERLTVPLDGLRSLLLRLLSRLVGPVWMRAFVTQPELRIAFFGALSVVMALLMTVFCPLEMLAVSPLVLGVPHLIADVRYLVAQPGYHRRLRLALPVGAALLFSAFGSAFGWGMKAGLLAVLATLLLAGGRAGEAQPLRTLCRRAAGILAVLGLVAVGQLSDWYWLELGLAHLHNFVAVLLFCLFRRRGGKLELLPLFLFLLGAVALLAGALSATPKALEAFDDIADLSADGQRALLAPLLPLDWATRLVLLFAFAQAVHYAVWLRLIPEEARARPAPRPFLASLRALREDLGAPLLGLSAAVAVTLALFALSDLAMARTNYFRLALFHGHLEICVLCLWWLEGFGPPAQPRTPGG